MAPTVLFTNISHCLECSCQRAITAALGQVSPGLVAAVVVAGYQGTAATHLTSATSGRNFAMHALLSLVGQINASSLQSMP